VSLTSFPKQFFISPTAVERKETLTDFSLSTDAGSLEESIKEVGVISPVVLTQRDETLQVLCGHRRLRIAEKLGLEKIPASLHEPSLTDESKLAINLNDNSSHRKYSAMETGNIIQKFKDANASENTIIQKYMPIMGLERSKKLYLDYLAVEKFDPNAQKLIHDLNLPLRTFSIMYRWDSHRRQSMAALLKTLKPGANKCRDLLELVQDCATCQNKPVHEVLAHGDIQSVVLQGQLSPQEKYDRLHQVIYSWRNPHLSAIQKSVGQCLDELSLDPKTKVRIQESFESDELKIEIKFRSQKELIQQLEKLSQASHSEAMGKLIQIMNGLA